MYQEAPASTPDSGASTPPNPLEETEEPEESAVVINEEPMAQDEENAPPVRPTTRRGSRRLSTYESSEGIMDLEGENIGGTARRND